jgi:signal transduction histidine kinase
LGTVIDTENKERTRFARDLHDELGPIMSSVKIYANILSETDKPEKELAEARKQVCELCDLAVQTSRDISNNMMPGNLLQFGLEKALSDFSYRICQSGKFNINLETMLNTRPEKSIEINLYRVITELINNSIKHSGGDKIDIQLMHRKDKLILFFEDNGIGFDYNKVKLDADKIGNGLRNIINRLEFMNARYNIETSPGEGFSLSANLEWE